MDSKATLRIAGAAVALGKRALVDVPAVLIALVSLAVGFRAAIDQLGK